jgi:hypothetical protein
VPKSSVRRFVASFVVVVAVLSSINSRVPVVKYDTVL